MWTNCRSARRTSEACRLVWTSLRGQKSSHRSPVPQHEKYEEDDRDEQEDAEQYSSDGGSARSDARETQSAGAQRYDPGQPSMR